MTTHLADRNVNWTKFKNLSFHSIIVATSGRSQANLLEVVMGSLQGL